MKTKLLTPKFSLALCFISMSPLLLSSQQVTTVAGIPYPENNESNFTRTNPIDDTYFSRPEGLAFDSSNRLYITDENNLNLIIGNTCHNRLGPVFEPAFNGGFMDAAATQARMASPTGIAVSPADNHIYFCDFANHAIRKATPFVNVSNSQELSTFSGQGPSQPGHRDGNLDQALFRNPYGIVIAQNGDMYVSDGGNHVIRKISGDQISTLAGAAGSAGNINGSASQARFSTPQGLFLENDSLLYIADVGNRCIKLLNLNSLQVTEFIAPNTLLVAPRNITKAGNAFYISDLYAVFQYYDEALTVFAGDVVEPGDVDGNGTDARFTELSAIIFDHTDSSLLVCDKGINTIKKIQLDPNIFLNTPTLISPNTQIQMYPNPAQNRVHFTMPSNEEISVQIVDIQGKKVITESLINPTNSQIDVSSLPNGIYFCTIQSASSGTFLQKLVIAR